MCKARERKDLDEEEQGQLDRLLTVSPEVRTVHTLLHAFLTMVRERNHQQLRSWMKEASTSGIAELKSFVAGVERDYDAVKEALRQPWLQGPTEGKVNKLKTIKRVMYGRAGFPLFAPANEALNVFCHRFTKNQPELPALAHQPSIGWHRGSSVAANPVPVWYGVPVRD